MNLLSAFENFNKAVPAQGPLASLRQAGYDYAVIKGLPTRKDEAWHYTSVKSLTESEFVLAPTVNLSHDGLKQVQELLNTEFTNLVFVNGE